MNLRRMIIAAAISLLATIACDDTKAAEMPSKFRGVWGDCDKTKDVGELPFVVVTARGYEAHETSCSLISSSRIKGTDRLSLTFSGESEGEQHKSEEDWSITNTKTEVLRFVISQPFLVIIRNEGHVDRHKKCSFSATPLSLLLHR
jgi:hypothetical protein